MKKNLITACLYTAVTAIALGLVYPLTVTALAQIFFHDKANGQLITRGNKIIGSAILGQPFTGAGFFHSRPSAAGTGYDASASSGSNLAPTSKALIASINARAKAESNGTSVPSVPIDLVTASGSGLDPDITPAAALYQVPRIAHQRNLPETTVRNLVIAHIQPRQFGLLGEPRVNVLALNLALEQLHK